MHFPYYRAERLSDRRNATRRTPAPVFRHICWLLLTYVVGPCPTPCLKPGTTTKQQPNQLNVGNKSSIYLPSINHSNDAMTNVILRGCCWKQTTVRRQRPGLVFFCSLGGTLRAPPMLALSHLFLLSSTYTMYHLDAIQLPQCRI